VGFFDPKDVSAFKRFDLVGVALNPVKRKVAAALMVNLGSHDVIAWRLEILNLSLNQCVDGILDLVLKPANAKKPGAVLSANRLRHARELPRLGR